LFDGEHAHKQLATVFAERYEEVSASLADAGTASLEVNGELKKVCVVAVLLLSSDFK
jgi:hypothetical protein